MGAFADLKRRWDEPCGAQPSQVSKGETAAGAELLVGHGPAGFTILRPVKWDHHKEALLLRRVTTCRELRN
jgi:hypothetical protein